MQPQDEIFIEAYNDRDNYPTLASLARILETSERSVRRRAKKYRDLGVNLIDRSQHGVKQYTTSSDVESEEDEKEIQAKLKLSQLRTENAGLRQEIKTLEREVLSASKIKEFIQGTATIKHYNSVPDWLTRRAKNSIHVTGIPVLFLSDIHFDEVVEPSQIGNINQYNHEIAVARIKTTFDTSINLLTKYMVNPKYDGIVLALGGDLLSGNIHEELAETNDQTILQSVISLTELLIDGITALADEFGKVFVPCVVGNHGRIHKKPRYKNKIFENFEWLIYQNLATYFDRKNDKRVSFYIPEGPDAIFSIYGNTFLLTHGDQFSGGNGIAGIFTPLMLGMARKQKRYAAMNKPFHIMMVGHFHQYIHTNSLIVNGTIKGFDEYSAGNGYQYEPPQQALFVVHPDYGVIMRMPVFCDKNEDKTIQDKIVIL